MSDRATGRHRAPARASTPLSSFGSLLSSKVGGHVSGVGRGGLVLAMSSGLVASMGIPADAAVRRDAVSAGPASPAVPAPVPAPAFEPSFDSSAAGLVSGAPVTAPSTATITFDHTAFSAVATSPPPASRRAGRSRRRLDVHGPTGQVATDAPDGVGSSPVIVVASRYRGVRYRYGGTAPTGFDCSGYVQYVYGQLGYGLPRTADEQWNATTRISRSEARPGDLVFFVRGGGASHVGIYAGKGTMYDAGRPGQVITRRAIWSAAVEFGRVA